MVSERLPRAKRREQLLAVSRQVLADCGYHDTTMTDIAQAAGVTKPVLYQHFTSKHQLYQTLLHDIGVELETAVVAATAKAADPREQVVAGISAFVDYVDDNDAGFRIFYNGLNRNDDDWATIVTDVESSLCDAIVALLDVETMTVDRRRVVARGIMGSVESMVRYAWFDNGRRTPKTTLTADLIDLIWGGVRSIGGDAQAFSSSRALA